MLFNMLHVNVTVHSGRGALSNYYGKSVFNLAFIAFQPFNTGLKHELDFSIYVVPCVLFYNFCELPQAVCKLSHVGIYLERGIFTITATFEFFVKTFFCQF